MECFSGRDSTQDGQSRSKKILHFVFPCGHQSACASGLPLDFTRLSSLDAVLLVGIALALPMRSNNQTIRDSSPPPPPPDISTPGVALAIFLGISPVRASAAWASLLRTGLLLRSLLSGTLLPANFSLASLLFLTIKKPGFQVSILSSGKVGFPRENRYFKIRFLPCASTNTRILHNIAPQCNKFF